MATIMVFSYARQVDTIHLEIGKTGRPDFRVVDTYRQTFDISRTLVGNNNFDHSDGEVNNWDEQESLLFGGIQISLVPSFLKLSLTPVSFGKLSFSIWKNKMLLLDMSYLNYVLDSTLL